MGCPQPPVTPALSPAAGALRVSQVPGELWVPAGEEVTLWCRVLAAEPWDLLRVEWVKDGARGALCAARLRPGTSTAPAPCGPRLRMAWDPPSATLSLHRAQGEDAGRYLCRVTVEIPHHGTATGNGTRLHVTAGTGRALSGPFSLGPRWGPWDRVLWGRLVGSLGVASLWGLWREPCPQYPIPKYPIPNTPSPTPHPKYLIPSTPSPISCPQIPHPFFPLCLSVPCPNTPKSLSPPVPCPHLLSYPAPCPNTPVPSCPTYPCAQIAPCPHPLPACRHLPAGPLAGPVTAPHL
uniref:Ig-like domain-containing protein n=1 Tax=Strigops habroptila TaxID=2489341 RepID=A0A672UGH9_STRHB